MPPILFALIAGFITWAALSPKKGKKSESNHGMEIPAKNRADQPRSSSGGESGASTKSNNVVETAPQTPPAESTKPAEENQLPKEPGKETEK